MKLPNTLKYAYSVFSDFKEPWFIAGGWAIDLAIGRVTREHGDIDICIFRESLPQFLNYFKEWKIEVCVPGTSQRLICESVEDVKAPRHELHVIKRDNNIEVLLNEKQGNNVVFRRDTSIVLPIETFTCRTKEKIPFVHPAWQLLFKAKYAKEEDQHDFNAVVKILSKHERKWLYQALSLHQPESEWLRELKKLL